MRFLPQRLARLTRSFRASALPTAMIFVVAVGIYSVTMPSMTGAVEVRRVLLERDQRLMTTALAALQVGRAQTYYTTVAQFRAYLITPPVMPAAFANLNGYNVNLIIRDNDEDPDGNNTLLEQQTDTDLVLTMEAIVQDLAPDLTVIKQVRMAMDIRVQRLTEYNFASSSFGNNAGSSLASRHWYGNMLIANDKQGTVNTTWYDSGGIAHSHQGYNYWNFSGRQYFHGTLHSTGFDGDQSNHEFTGVGAEHLYYHHKDHAHAELQPLPKVPDGLDITVELAPGGSIYDEASRQNLIINDNVEIFLHPNGQIWTRPFNSGPADWEPIRDGGGVPIDQHQKTILINGKALVRGVVTGRLTIASNDSIMINGNIDNPAYNQNHLGLVATEAIYYENRKIYDTDKIQDVRPIDAANWSSGGATSGGEITAVSPGTATSDFNFIAQPVFDTTPGGEWDSIKANPALMNKFGGSISGSITGYMDTIGQFHENNYNGLYGNESRPGRMPRDGALVFASLASGWYISPAVAYPGLDSSQRIDSQGGSFEVRGTYSMGIGVDYMATWSMNGGSMTYQVHPSQQATAPDFFIPVVQAYPEIVYGSWRRLE